MNRLRRVAYVIATLADRIANWIDPSPHTAWEWRSEWPPSDTAAGGVDSPPTPARRGSPKRL